MTFGQVLLMMFGAMIVENFIFSKFYGCCPFLGVSEKPDTALGMGMAVTFVITLSSAVTWAVYYLLLKPFGLEYLKTVAFILVIAALVQFIEMFLRKFIPSLYTAMGIFLPLITTNCAVLGFTLAIVVFAGLRARIDYDAAPRSFRGFPLTLIAAGLLAMAFAGFSGVSFG